MTTTNEKKPVPNAIGEFEKGSLKKKKRQKKEQGGGDEENAVILCIPLRSYPWGVECAWPV